MDSGDQRTTTDPSVIVVAGWITMGIVATSISAIAAYRYLTMPCEIVVCGGGTLALAILTFIGGMFCMSVGETVMTRQREQATMAALRLNASQCAHRRQREDVTV